MKKYILFCILFLMFYINTNAQNTYKFVNDGGKYFTEEEKQKLNEKLRGYNNKTSVEFTLLTIETLEANIQKIYDLKENDIMIFLVKKERKVRIEFGYQIENYIGEEQKNAIVAEQMIPNFKQENFYKGIDLAIDKVIELLGDNFND